MCGLVFSATSGSSPRTSVRTKNRAAARKQVRTRANARGRRRAAGRVRARAVGARGRGTAPPRLPRGAREEEEGRNPAARALAFPRRRGCVSLPLLLLRSVCASPPPCRGGMRRGRVAGDAGPQARRRWVGAAGVGQARAPPSHARAARAPSFARAIRGARGVGGCCAVLKILARPPTSQVTIRQTSKFQMWLNQLTPYK